MRHVKCQSGLRGYQCRLRANYSSFEEFEAYSETYGIAKRLGFKSAANAWRANPVIQGSTNPGDLCKIIRGKRVFHEV
jgi:hypothetical protein